MAKFSKTIHSDFSGHTMHVSEIDPDKVPALESKETYKQFYVVHNWDIEGLTFMYLAKGNPKAPREIVVWYAKTGAFWSSYGLTFKEAIEGAQKDGWLYA